VPEECNEGCVLSLSTSVLSHDLGCHLHPRAWRLVTSWFPPDGEPALGWSTRGGAVATRWGSTEAPHQGIPSCTVLDCAWKTEYSCVIITMRISR